MPTTFPPGPVFIGRERILMSRVAATLKQKGDWTSSVTSEVIPCERSPYRSEEAP